MSFFGPHEGIDQEVVAVALDEALVAILDQEGQFRVAPVQAELLPDFHQVLELHSLYVIYWHVKDLIGIESLLSF